MQVNLVGTRGLKNVMAITDGELQIRGMVGSPKYSVATLTDKVTTNDLLGDGQVRLRCFKLFARCQSPTLRLIFAVYIL